MRVLADYDYNYYDVERTFVDAMFQFVLTVQNIDLKLLETRGMKSPASIAFIWMKLLPDGLNAGKLLLVRLIQHGVINLKLSPL